MITCEATSQGKIYAGVFVTDNKPAKEGAKEGAGGPAGAAAKP